MQLPLSWRPLWLVQHLLMFLWLDDSRSAKGAKVVTNIDTLTLSNFSVQQYPVACCSDQFVRLSLKINHISFSNYAQKEYKMVASLCEILLFTDIESKLQALFAEYVNTWQCFLKKTLNKPHAVIQLGYLNCQNWCWRKVIACLIKYDTPHGSWTAGYVDYSNEFSLIIVWWSYPWSRLFVHMSCFWEMYWSKSRADASCTANC